MICLLKSFIFLILVCVSLSSWNIADLAYTLQEPQKATETEDEDDFYEDTSLWWWQRMQRLCFGMKIVHSANILSGLLSREDNNLLCQVLILHSFSPLGRLGMQHVV